ncbi:ribosomal protein S5 domain 2-type protein [Phycomyces blakesleeanus]|uniref:Impact N-terminal domain-containing protein n=2 Tax=Phycomyces blakesleeanus TaxID=4837 RepID=A0A162UVK4_PHYB8|nr:hypothetical protein PHYBLDRAFT_163412 [Phycomyces blakesleeanus NRRL 1555(-)]OAD78293.1 hypothetical protein PHYBLDRAFT_163412 [Phycomyces blakesleeanus NRRL 1555(-)]|eukprot:XP_018296333.1 hypothetical protein PHYBLDRAFT_163412 [Phycomyces blakesleeanus NRRL 1555(-)]
MLSSCSIRRVGGCYFSRRWLSSQNDIPIYSTKEPLVDRKSVFVAHVAQVQNVDQVRVVRARLLENKKIAKATHNIMAYRIISGNQILERGDDDGETAAGGRLLHLLQMANVENVMVIVSRWFGGTQLGADRFRDINKCAQVALKECGHIKGKHQ